MGIVNKSFWKERVNGSLDYLHTMSDHVFILVSIGISLLICGIFVLYHQFSIRKQSPNNDKPSTPKQSNTKSSTRSTKSNQPQKQPRGKKSTKQNDKRESSTHSTIQPEET